MAIRSAVPGLRPAAPLLVAVAALAAASWQGAALRHARHEANPAPAVESLSGTSAPLVSFAAVALGGFRGLIADLLWLRASDLQEHRRFVELVQLSDWITQLEPTNDDVWIFHAWNLSYNVSFLLSRPEDQWSWIENGISLLRDRGIPLNPQSPALKRELGWIFQHKIGMASEEAGGPFRTFWAREVAGYLGENGAAPEAGSLAEEELAETLRLDAAFMRRLEAEYGAIDWRVPAAQSLYWARRGLECPCTDPEDLSCRRMVYSSLMEMARRFGRVVGNPAGDEEWSFRAAPNLALLDAAIAENEATMARHAFAGVRHAYVWFLHDAILLRAMEGNKDSSLAYHRKFVDFFRDHGVSVPADYEAFPTLSEDQISNFLADAGYP